MNKCFTDIDYTQAKQDVLPFIKKPNVTNTEDGSMISHPKSLVRHARPNPEQHMGLIPAAGAVSYKNAENGRHVWQPYANKLFPAPSQHNQEQGVNR